MTDLDAELVGLVLDDRDPQAVFDAMVALAEERIPNWSLNNGSVEAVLLEALALGVADAVYAVNRIPTIILESLLGLYGVARQSGQPGYGSVLLTLDGTRTLTVSAGQRLVVPDTGSVLVVSADTTGNTVTSLTVPVHTESATGAENGLAVGTALDVLDAIPYVATAALSAAIVGGTEDEDDGAYLARASAVLARVTASLVVPSHFTAYALEQGTFGRAMTADLFDPGSGPGADPGHITVAVYGHGGLASSAAKADLLAKLQARSAAMMQVHVADAVITTVNVDVTVHARAGTDHDAVRDAAAAAIRAWLDPMAWEWEEPVRPLDLAAVVAAVPDVDYVDSVNAPATTQAVAVPMGLAKAGTVTVTVL